ncbi:hypothetical protein [Dyadobacter psychrotolerans]|uniref:Extracellular endo-alpha-(1->5)-L-arabinanase C-terminal domain-containing protein n=1 Tax=Dyadobacter psychrotolerans TaxID=2541721 RepID=A0A4R5DH94_9BACT|nr:hypothetical protein [Dyadobacter psychrotolerans]TDE13396.1 hypothetical protein E0F88_20400 [Dyadobacter psychrotolerans]
MTKVASLAKLILITRIFCACNSQSPTTEHLLGKWQNTKDGGNIVLLKNNIFTASNLNSEMFHDGKLIKLKTTDGEGTWELSNEGSGWKVELRFKKLKGLEKGYHLPVNISERFGDYGLFVWKGDPDSGNRYSFEKRSD